MLTISIEPGIVGRLHEIIANEDSEDAVFRVKEVKVGGGCKSHMELRLSIDEREDPDEEVEVKVEEMPFVVSNDVIDTYGERFEIYTSSDMNIPAVRVGK